MAMVSRAMVALAFLLALVASSIAQGTDPADRIAATFYQRAPQQSRAAAPSNKVPGAFRADPDVPIRIEADSLVEVFDGDKQMVFSGIVKLQLGNFELRTTSLTAFYLGQSDLSNRGEWRVEQLTRVEAGGRVLVISKDAQTTATADWATLDVMAGTVLMGDSVVVSRGKDVAQAPKLKIDLTTGMYRFEP